MLLNRRPNQENEKDEEEEGEDKQGRDVYQNALMAASCKGTVPRSVLSFSNTPSAGKGWGLYCIIIITPF